MTINKLFYFQLPFDLKLNLTNYKKKEKLKALKLTLPNVIKKKLK
jgi:hypothetical protein